MPQNVPLEVSATIHCDECGVLKTIIENIAGAIYTRFNSQI